MFTNAIIEHIILSTYDIKKSFLTKNLRTNCNAGHATKFDIYIVYEDELLKKPWLFLKVYFRAFIPIVDTIRDKKAFYVTGKGYRNSRIYCSILYPFLREKPNLHTVTQFVEIVCTAKFTKNYLNFPHS